MSDTARCPARHAAAMRCVRNHHTIGRHVDGHGREWGEEWDGTTTGTEVTEYGQLMSGGGYQLFNQASHIEDIYPLADRIKAGRRHGGKVFRRRVLVLEDWEETGCPRCGSTEHEECYPAPVEYS
jgi:hypothetical protein